jgi:hypothetical protein
MLIDFVISSVQEILTEDRDVISRLVASRKRYESWLQVEIFKRFIRRFPNVDIMLERAHPFGDKARCDLWCREEDGRESWIEIKTCVTNYGQQYGPNSARPITMQISEARRDVERLMKLPVASERHLYLLVYPMPGSGDLPRQWSDHMIRLQVGGYRMVQVLAAPICVAMRKASVIAYTIFH